MITKSFYIFLKLWSKVYWNFLLFSLFFSSFHRKYLKFTKLDIAHFVTKLFKSITKITYSHLHMKITWALNLHVKWCKCNKTDLINYFGRLQYRHMRARMALSLFKDVPLRTRRVLLPQILYSDNALQVLNELSLIIIHISLFFWWNKSAYIVSFKGFCSMEFNIVSLFAFRTCLTSLCQCEIRVQYC